jgi:hypothetical protein
MNGINNTQYPMERRQPTKEKRKRISELKTKYSKMVDLKCTPKADFRLDKNVRPNKNLFKFNQTNR